MDTYYSTLIIDLRHCQFGITPYTSIFLAQRQNGQIGGNRPSYANKPEVDIILKGELEAIPGDRFVNILTEQKSSA